VLTWTENAAAVSPSELWSSRTSQTCINRLATPTRVPCTSSRRSSVRAQSWIRLALSPIVPRDLSDQRLKLLEDSTVITEIAWEPGIRIDLSLSNGRRIGLHLPIQHEVLVSASTTSAGTCSVISFIGVLLRIGGSKGSGSARQVSVREGDF
jgi:hypothetical protein